MKFFTDTHIALPAIEQLRLQGIDMMRSIEAGFSQDTDDEVLLEYATREGRIVVTCDQDFENYSAAWQTENRSHASVLYFNMANGECSDIGLIVKHVMFIYAAADPEKDLKNQFWRLGR